MQTSSIYDMIRSQYMRFRVLVVGVVLLAAIGFIVSAGAVTGETKTIPSLTGEKSVESVTQSTGYAGISNEDPARGTTLDSSEDVTITFTVDYDTGDEEPGYISVSFGEDQYEQPHKEVNIDKQSGSKEITITRSVHSDWNQAVLDIHVWPESDSDFVSEIDGDNIEYGVDGSSGNGGELPSAEIDCSVDIVEGESFLCSGSNSEAPSGYINQYEWEFDGDIEYGETADFTADSHGSWFVSLTVTDNEGNTDTTSESISVDEANVAPVADISCDSSVTIGESVSCDAHGTSDESDNIENYDWSFGTEGSGFGVESDYTFTEPGTHTVEMTVTDEEGESDVASQTVTVEDQPPEIEQLSLGTSSVDAGESVDVSATVTDPADRNIGMSYEWDVNGQKHQGSSATVTPHEVGVQEIELTVQNEYGTTTTKTETITVNNVAPSIDVSARNSIEAASPESFAVSVKNPNNGTTDVILFVDGDEVERDRINSHSETVQLAHRFTPGKKTVKIEARDEHGGVVSDSFQVEVDGKSPSIKNYGPEKLEQDISTGDTVDFSITPSHLPDQAVEVNWFVDDEEVKSGSKTFSKTFTDNDYQNVKAVIVDEHGLKTSQTWRVQADTFTESPRVEDHSTAERLSVTRDIDALTFSFRHPEANERDAVVEIRATTPPGISVVGAQNADETDQAQSAVVREVAPGNQEELSLEVSVTDDSLIDEEVSFSYEILYYPDDSSESSVQVFEDSLNLYVGQDTSDTNDETPGFGVIAAVLALLMVSTTRIANLKE